MNAIALLETAVDTTERVVRAACPDCGVVLRNGEDLRCEGCADLALHNGECRDCGKLLRDQDLHRMTCADCLG